MEVTVLEKHQLTFEDLEVEEYFILLEDNDLMIKIDGIEEDGVKVNAYSINDNIFYSLSPHSFVKKVRIKEIIVEEI